VGKLIARALIAAVSWVMMGAGLVDEARMKAAPAEPDNWLTSGRDQNGTYYSPLTRINAKNVGGLGFAWQYDLATHRGQEATPIVVDGVM
jgi:quinohemoprotein ethanol dehydrogenase